MNDASMTTMTMMTTTNDDHEAEMATFSQIQKGRGPRMEGVGGLGGQSQVLRSQVCNPNLYLHKLS